MNRYKIRCTEAQTKKALELGAPIKFTEWNDDNSAYVGLKGEIYAIIPTAEQMIGWLEEQNIFVNFAHTSFGYDSWIKRRSDNKLLSKSLGFVSSRKEATLAAIDAALDYLLLTNKQQAK